MRNRLQRKPQKRRTRKIEKTNCHTERSEVSNFPSRKTNNQTKLEISFKTIIQWQKH